MLLTKTLRSTTFRLALISIAVFGAIVIALFGYVYWATTNFVLSRSDSAIEAERAMLRNVYDSGGRNALTLAIEQHDAVARLQGSIYLLADESFAPVAGNLKEIFRNITAIGNDLVFRGSVASPTLRIDGMTIAGE